MSKRAIVVLGVLIGVLTVALSASLQGQERPVDKAAISTKLRRVVTIAPESEGGGARPEVIATADRVFVVYLGNVARAFADGSSGPTFRVKIFDHDLSKVISSRILVNSTEAYGRPTDIRVASDGKDLYAFYETVLDNDGGFL